MHSNIWRIAAGVIRKNKLKSLLTLAAVVLSIVTALVPPLVLGQIVDGLSDKRSIAIHVALGYLMILAVSGVMESVQNILITVMGQKITHGIRSAMSGRLEELPTEYYVNHETGKITSRFVNDVDAVDSLFTNGIISMFADVFKVISIMAVIFVKSLGLGIIMCVLAPLIFLMTMMFQKRMRSAQLRNRVAVARVNQHVPETIQNIRMIHSFSCEWFMEKKYGIYIEEGYRAMDKSNFYDAIYSPIVICISSVVIAVMMVCSSLVGELQQFFAVTVGSAVAVIAYVGKVFDPIESIGMEIQNIQSALAGVARIDEFLNEKGRTAGSAVDVDIHNGITIEFDRVSFGYGDGRMILSNMSFAIAQGERVNFTGRTGAGKSTVFKLILGLYTPTEGRVTINGIDCTAIAAGDKRRIFGYVEQHFGIIEGTIRDQISLLDDTITDEAIWGVLRLCGLEDKIQAMPDNIYSEMKASDFSQGELQLMSIARALVLNPQVMLLDEITANIDSATEQNIMKVLSEASRDRTVISISHRQVGEGRIIPLEIH